MGGMARAALDSPGEVWRSAQTVPHVERTNLYDLTRAELTARLAAWGFSPVHAARLWNYLYWECAGSLAAMPELPAKVRTRLAAECTLDGLPVAHELHSRDGFTRKFLLGLADGRRIETVLMRFTGRATACVSSQAGCAMGCGFCATGQMGFQRHLTAGEIVAQAVHLQRLLREERPDPELETQNPKLKTLNPKPRGAAAPRLRNLVLMGMGEPLHNYDAVMQAVEILRDQNGFALAASRITLSTVGVVPGIRRLADEARPVHLAVSLHAATQAERAALVPVAKRWPLDELMAACRYYCEKLQRRIFFEFALIAGKNDSAEQAHAVGRLLRGLPAQVNLIPLNPTAGYDGGPSPADAARRFQKILSEHYALPSTVRQRRGLDIAAGCGQLAGTES
jgi:23S rRNA (adenine2503-C2)-methyltransferase